jgi:hypothetical protein
LEKIIIVVVQFFIISQRDWERSGIGLPYKVYNTAPQ